MRAVASFLMSLSIAGSGSFRSARDYKGSNSRFPLPKGRALVMGRFIVLVVAPGSELDLQRRMVDPEAFVEIVGHRIDEDVVVLRIGADQVRGHGHFARAQRPDVHVVYGGHAGAGAEEGA